MLLPGSKEVQRPAAVVERTIDSAYTAVPGRGESLRLVNAVRSLHQLAVRRLFFSCGIGKTRRKETIKNRCKPSKKRLTAVIFGTPGWIRTSGLSLRRRPLYPTELRGLIQKIFNFRAQQDSNELPLRRRPLYPTELRGLIQGSFCLTGFDQAVSPACLVVYRAGPAGQGGSRSLLLHHYRRRRIPCQPENHAPHSGFPARTSR